MHPSPDRVAPRRPVSLHRTGPDTILFRAVHTCRRGVRGRDPRRPVWSFRVRRNQHVRPFAESRRRRSRGPAPGVLAPVVGCRAIGAHLRSPAGSLPTPSHRPGGHGRSGPRRGGARGQPFRALGRHRFRGPLAQPEPRAQLGERLRGHGGQHLRRTWPSPPPIRWSSTRAPGEQNNRQSTSWGNGVYRSDDGGESWEHLGLEGNASHRRGAGPSAQPRCRLRGRQRRPVERQRGAGRLPQLRWRPQLAEGPARG